MQMKHDRKEIEGLLKKYRLSSLFVDPGQLTLCCFKRGEAFFTEGEPLDLMSFLVKGKIKIFTTTPEGKTLIVRFKTPLAVLGDIEYIKQTSVVNTVEAVTDGMIIGVSFKSLREDHMAHIPFLHFLLEEVTQKFYTEARTTSFNMLYPVEVRLASYLLSLSEDAEGTLFYKEMQTENLSEMADVLGTSYRHLNRVIHQLEKEEIIERRQGRLHIADLGKLRERAEGNIYE